MQSITEGAIAEAMRAAQAAQGAPPGPRIEMADPAEPGLRLRIGPRSATWSVLVYAQDVVRVRAGLGEWPHVSLEAARASARAARAHFKGLSGQDEPNTLGGVLDQYVRRKLPQLRRGQEVGRALRRGLASLKHRDIQTIARRDIVLAIDVVAESAPIQANRTLAYTKAFFGWAVGRGYLEANPALSVPKAAREVSRERTPSLAELTEIWRASACVGYPFGPIVQLLILTATRREEVASMELSELDLPEGEASGCWTVPAHRSKNGRAIRIPLSPAARNVVQAALEARECAGPLVFSTTGRTPFSGWSKAKKRLDAIIAENRRRDGIAAPMAPWRLHDLRRAFATAACDVLHIDPAVADRCLNHVGAATTSTISRVYARSEMLDQRREALERWADLVLAKMEG